MSVDDFTLMLTYLTEVCWMTAAGRLDLITAQDKTGTLSAGICSKTDIISHKVLIHVHVYISTCIHEYMRIEMAYFLMT